MSFELRAGAESLTDTVAYTPYDSLVDLINALGQLLRDDDSGGATVRWAHNPDELDFTFSASGGEAAQLDVDWYRDQLRADGVTGERVFSFTGSRLDVCQPFWQALRDLQSDVEVDEFTRNWGREFPARELQQLTGEIEAYRQKRAHDGAELSAP